MIELVALDMAGTTIDDRGAVYDALRGAVEETGAPVAPEDLQTWMGTDKLTAIGALMRLGGLDPENGRAEAAFGRFRELLDAAYTADPPVALPGVADALAALRERGIRIALTTGFDDAVALAVLASIGWEVGGLLDAVVTTSDVPEGRPAPYLIHTAMQRAGVTDVRRTLAAGDTIVDLRAARNAGVFAVGVLTGALDRAAMESEPHDRILGSIAELPELIDELNCTPAG